MKKFGISLIALITAAAPAFAESHMKADEWSFDNMANMDYAQLIRSRDITGGEIYTLNEANDEGNWGATEYTKVGSDWNEIGEIEDIVLDRNGRFAGIVAEVGGFLDIGDKHVLIRLDEVKLVPVDDKSYSFVTRLSEEQLEERKSVDEGWWD